MGDDRYERGRQRLGELAGEQGESVMAGLEEVSPDLARYVVEFGYGDIYSRPALDDHARQLAAISALSAMGGAEPQLEYHIGIALNVGVPPGAGGGDGRLPLAVHRLRAHAERRALDQAGLRLARPALQ